MAKLKQTTYKVTNLSPLTYNGKTADVGELVNDLPGESISWLLEGGHIVPVEEEK